MSRFRLIPARWQVTRLFEGTQDEALSEGKALSGELGCPVLVCEAPERGIVRVVRLVGAGSRRRVR